MVPTYNSFVSLQMLALQAYKTVPAWHYKVWCGEPHCSHNISFIIRSSSHLELYNKFRGGLRTLVSPCLRRPSGWEWRAIIEHLPARLPPSIVPLPRQKTDRDKAFQGIFSSVLKLKHLRPNPSLNFGFNMSLHPVLQNMRCQTLL